MVIGVCVGHRTSRQNIRTQIYRAHSLHRI